VTQMPSLVAGNASYDISWSISGVSSVTHTNVHWGTSPGSPTDFGTTFTGGSGSYSDTLTAPASGTIYFFIHTEADGMTVNTPEQSIAVLSVSVTSVPASVAGNASYSISWSISEASSVTHTNVHWGTSPGSPTDFGTTFTGGSGSYSDTLTAPASGTIYFFINTDADGLTLDTPEQTIAVISVSVTSAPSSVAGNASYNISWSIFGASSVMHTNVHWGTLVGHPSNFGTTFTGGSGSYSDTLTAPASGRTVYFIIDTVADDLSFKTPEQSIAVGNSGANINAGHAGAWFNPETSGQGQFIDVQPDDAEPDNVQSANVEPDAVKLESPVMFISWFTFTDAASANPFEQRWFTAQGNYSGNIAELELFETLGGRFDDPQAVTTIPVGAVTLSFSDCGQGQMTYSLDEEELQGTFPLTRVIPGSGNVCEERSGNSPQVVDINAGMDGAWFDPDTPGQGFFIDVHPDPGGGNFIFVSWFTFGEDTASGQRWLTAQGSFEGSFAEIDVFETTGGSFDDPQEVNIVKVGAMTIDFTDCSNALLTYSLTDNGAEGDIEISRVIPGGQALCEELDGLE